MTSEEQLKAALAEVERLRAALAEKDVKLASKDEQIKSLQDQLLWLRKKVYGHMSEKHLPIDPLQLNLFEQEHMKDEDVRSLRRKWQRLSRQSPRQSRLRRSLPAGISIPVLFL